MQYSFEGARLFGEATESVFTRYLVEGLRDGTADLDGDGNITTDELYAFVYDRASMATTTATTPTAGSSSA